MSNLLFGLNIGRSALLANQAALDVAGHNLANVQTEGYSRQRAEMTQGLPVQVSFNTFGSGVAVEKVERLHMAWVERQVNRVQVQNGYDSTLSNGLTELQTVLGEPSGSGLSAALSDMWNSWEALSAQPGDSGLRAQVVNNAEALTHMYNSKIESLEDVESQFDASLRDSLDDLNARFQHLADLNGAIVKASAQGGQANDLRDQRDRMVSDITKSLGVEVEPDGAALNLRLAGGGPYVVSGIHSFEIAGMPDAEGRLSAFSVGTGPVSLQGGEVGALVELRDTHSPELRNQLGLWMTTITDRVNGVHAAGFDRDGLPGLNVFEWTGAATVVNMSASSGVLNVDPDAALAAGTHHLQVTAVTGFSQNANGQLPAGARIDLRVPAGTYAGAKELNTDYHLRVVAQNTSDNDLEGLGVQLFRGEEAVGQPLTLAGIGAPSVNNLMVGTVDGVTFTADLSLGPATRFSAGNRSAGWSTVGEVSLDDGPATAVDLTAANNLAFTGGTGFGFTAGATARVNFSAGTFSDTTFTLSDPAGRLEVNPVLGVDSDRVAAASVDNASLNGEIARKIADLATQRLFDQSNETAAHFMGRTVQELGSKGQQALVFEEASTSILLQLQAQKDSISGVNVDEEMIQLIQYQRGFQAAAKFLNTVDGLLDHLINSIGR